MNVQGARALRKLTLRSDQLPAWNPPFRAFYINDQDDGRLRVLPDVSIVRSGSAFLVHPRLFWSVLLTEETRTRPREFGVPSHDSRGHIPGPP